MAPKYSKISNTLTTSPYGECGSHIDSAARGCAVDDKDGSDGCDLLILAASNTFNDDGFIGVRFLIERMDQFMDCGCPGTSEKE